MLGSLTLYRRLLLENVFSHSHIRSYIPFCRSQPDLKTLPSVGHGIAGIMAGTTVSLIAAPVEHIKARLQVQYSADKTQRMYSGPIDCVRKIVCEQFLASNSSAVNRLTNDSLKHMVSAACTVDCSQRWFSAHSSSSGGDHTTFLRAT